jgi:DNA-binding NarL/FixJ family response regulator
MAAPPQQFDWKRQRILLLDQDDQFRFWARGVFNRLGVAEVISTANGFDALHALERTDATLGMVDLEFKGMAAAEFITGLRKTRARRLSSMPIVLMAKTQDKKAIYDASVAGIEGIIVKPIAEKAMLTRVMTTLLKPERIVLNANFAGPDRRELPRIAPQPPAKARPPGKAPTQAKGVVMKSGGKPAAKKNTGPSEPNETLEPIKAPPPKKISATISDEDPAPAPPPKKAAGTVGDDDLVAPPTKPAVRDFSAEVTETPKEKDTEDEWKSAVAPKPKKKKKNKRESKPSIDIPAILDAHQTWLDSNGQDGEKARLEGADLTGADLAGANLANASLRGANLSDSDCSGASLTSAELRRVNFSGAQLAGADLSYAAMRHANLTLANMSGAILVGADLAGAQFAKANVKQADLTRASLLGADLADADMEEAGGLTQAQVGKANGTKTTKLPPGLKAGSPEEWSENL